MNIDELLSMTDELERLNAVYASGFEDKRLSYCQAANVEFITTMRVLRDYVRADTSVLDLGAGTGVYTLPLSEVAQAVDAVELADANVSILRNKTSDRGNVRVFHQSASDLSAFADESYDVVMLMGPLYHIANIAERDKCICEAMRVCKSNGVVMAAFISNDFVPLTECCYRDFFNPEEPHTYDHETFQMQNCPFVFYTVEQMRQMLTACGLRIYREVATDGASELLEDKINAMSQAAFAEYLKYHLYCSEKPEMFGIGNHKLFVAKKS